MLLLGSAAALITQTMHTVPGRAEVGSLRQLCEQLGSVFGMKVSVTVSPLRSLLWIEAASVAGLALVCEHDRTQRSVKRFGF